MMKQCIECVIFDFGGVIGYPHDQSRVKTMAKLTQMEEDTFKKAYFEHRIAYDQGLINKYDYWRRITDGKIELKQDLIERLVYEDYKGWVRINRDVINFIQQLRSEVKGVVLLSNINFEAKQHIEEELKLFELFDATFCSCDLKLMKPSKAIYDYVVKHLEILPSKCLFIDDTKENIQGAQAIGMQGIVFKNLEQVELEIEKAYIYSIGS